MNGEISLVKKGVKYMEWILSNWYLLVAIIAVLWMGAYALYRFYDLPSSEQLAKVREWLVYACSLAEKDLGSGTGQLKLRYVYDLFLNKFPWLAKLLSFEAFSKMVDSALEDMKHAIETNNNVKAFIEGAKNE